MKPLFNHGQPHWLRQHKLRTLASILIVAAAALALTGCWDRIEVNDVAIVSGTAFDKVGDKYRMAVQFPLAGQLGGAEGGGGGTAGTKSWYVESGTGKTWREATEKIQCSVSRRLYYAHRRVLIIGEEMARDGISTHMDTAIRNVQNRMSTFVVFAKGEALDLLNTDIVLEQQPMEMIREITINSMKKPRTVKHFINTMVTDGIDLAAPYFIRGETAVDDSGQPKPTVRFGGIAFFKEDKLAGFLSGDPGKGILWAMNQARKPTVTVEAPSGEGHLTVVFQENDVELHPRETDDGLVMIVRVHAFGNLYGNQSTYHASLDSMKELTQVVADKLKQEIEGSISTVQEHGSDICGFGNTIYRTKPKLWQTIKDDWDAIYPTVPVDVQIDMEIEHSGIILDPPSKPKE